MSKQTLKQAIVQALKQNLLPGLILQSFAVSLALLYFFVPATSQAFQFFGDLKATYTWKYSAIATALFGGILPFIYLAAIRQIHISLFGALLFYIVFWAYKGVEVDMFYQLQGHWFGNENNVYTIIKKTLVDQLGYSPLWATPTIVFAYIWMESGFRFSRLWQALRERELWQRHLPVVIISSWLIWVPAVSIVYSMPPLLQIPLFNLVLCFYVLLVATIGNNQKKTAH